RLSSSSLRFWCRHNLSTRASRRHDAPVPSQVPIRLRGLPEIRDTGARPPVEAPQFSGTGLGRERLTPATVQTLPRVRSCRFSDLATDLREVRFLRPQRSSTHRWPG